MDKQIFSGKTLKEAIDNAKFTLEETEENLIIKVLSDDKGGLFKSSKVEIEVINRAEIVPFIKQYLNKLIKNMGISAQIEIKVKDGMPKITIYSDDNKILIGKNGRTIDSLATIVRQVILNETGEHYHFQLDVGDYKLKREKNLVYLAKRVAREVYKSNVPVKLDPMNSYERRIIHTALADNPKITTESEGEEPNRCIVIKKVEDNKEEDS